MRAAVLMILVGVLASIGLAPPPAGAVSLPTTTVTASISNLDRPGEPFRVGIDRAIVHLNATNSDGSTPVGTFIVRDGSHEYWPLFSSTWPADQPLDPFTTAGQRDLTVSFYLHTGAVNTTVAASTTIAVNVVPLTLNPPAPVILGISTEGGSSVSQPAAFVVSKDTAAISVVARWQDGSRIRDLSEGTVNLYLDGSLIKTWTIDGSSGYSASAGPFTTTGTHVLRAEYVPVSTNFVPSTKEQPIQVIDANPAADALTTFFATLATCWAKFWLTLLGNPLGNMFSCPWF